MRLLALLLSLSLAAFGQAAAPQAKNPFVVHDDAVIALTHIRVIDGTGAQPREAQAIVIRGGKIDSITPMSAYKPPAGAKELDMSGKTAMPGIVGMHDHLYYPSPSLGSTGGNVALYPEHAQSFPRLYLAAGVTSIRTTGSVETYTDLELKKLIDSGKMVGPRMYITGPYLEGAGAYTPQMHQLRDDKDARETVLFWADRGATSFKAYMNITRAELKAAADAAHSRNLKITGHLCAVSFREAAEAGIDNLEHGLPASSDFVPDRKPDVCPGGTAMRRAMETLDIQSPKVQDLIKFLVSKKVALTSTLPVFEMFISDRKVPISQGVLDAMAPQAQAAFLASRNRAQNGPANWTQAVLKKEMDFEYAFAKAGGLLLAGLDPTGIGGVIAGYGDHREIELLVEAGFTPLEAIKIATSNGAEFMGESAKIGTLASGKLADILVVNGNPATKITDIENVEVVFKDGVAYDPAKLRDSVKGMVGVR